MQYLIAFIEDALHQHVAPKFATVKVSFLQREDKMKAETYIMVADVRDLSSVMLSYFSYNNVPHVCIAQRSPVFRADREQFDLFLLCDFSHTSDKWQVHFVEPLVPSWDVTSPVAILEFDHGLEEYLDASSFHFSDNVADCVGPGLLPVVQRILVRHFTIGNYVGIIDTCLFHLSKRPVGVWLTKAVLIVIGAEGHSLDLGGFSLNLLREEYSHKNGYDRETCHDDNASLDWC